MLRHPVSDVCFDNVVYQTDAMNIFTDSNKETNLQLHCKDAQALI
jgi:hypothetical protein